MGLPRAPVLKKGPEVNIVSLPTDLVPNSGPAHARYLPTRCSRSDRTPPSHGVVSRPAAVPQNAHSSAVPDILQVLPRTVPPRWRDPCPLPYPRAGTTGTGLPPGRDRGTVRRPFPDCPTHLPRRRRSAWSDPGKLRLEDGLGYLTENTLAQNPGSSSIRSPLRLYLKAPVKGTSHGCAGCAITPRFFVNPG